MNSTPNYLRRAILPITVFMTVLIVHFAWLWVFPEQDAVQSRWVTLEIEQSPLDLYVENQSYFLGYSYALALSFTVVAIRSYREHQCFTNKKFALGGLTFSWILAVAGCYLIGCCGSPMLVVYLSLFGSTFLKFAKPLVAFITTLSVALSWWWIRKDKTSNLRSCIEHPGTGKNV